MLGVSIGALSLDVTGPASAAQPAVGLGTAGSFGVLSGSTITNTGPTTVSGNVGVSPGTATPGLTAATVTNGTIHRGDAVAASAQADLTTGYDSAAGRGPATAVTPDLAGQRLAPGVYAAATLSLSGTVMLDAGGDPNAEFILKSDSTLITSSASTVELVNGANACHVFWQVGSSATLGTTTAFAGSILALTSISVDDAAVVNGRLLARNGAVTLIDDRINRPACGSTAPPSSAPPTSTPGSSAPGSSSPSVITSPTTTGLPTSASGTPGSGSGPAPSSGPSAPNAESAFPTTGPASGGTPVTITGTGFIADRTSVAIGGTTLPATAVTVTGATRLVFITPAHAAAMTDIVVTTEFGSSSRHGLTFTYIGSSGLAATGVSTLGLCALGLVLLVAGTQVLLSGQRSRGRHSR